MAKQKLMQEEKVTLKEKKERAPSYLSTGKVLNPEELKFYKYARAEIRRKNLLRKSKEMGAEIRYRQQQEDYNKTYAGKLTRGIRTAGQRGGVARYLYKKSLPPTNLAQRYKTVQGMKTGIRGRPKGTFDKRYSAYGGVYGYRKMLNAQLREQKLEAYRRATISPQQQAMMNQMQRQEAYRRSNPEGRAIPDTYGDVALGGIMDEINRASNIFR